MNNNARAAVVTLTLAAINLKNASTNAHLAAAVEDMISRSLAASSRGNTTAARDFVDQALGMLGVTDPASLIAA